MAIVAKFQGEDPENEYHNGIPARDLSEEDFGALTDEEKATLAASPLYEMRGAAVKEAASAERRVERSASVEAPAEGKK